MAYSSPKCGAYAQTMADMAARLADESTGAPSCFVNFWTLIVNHAMDLFAAKDFPIEHLRG